MLPALDAHCHLEHDLLLRDAAGLRALLWRCRQQRVETLVVSLDLTSGAPEHDLDSLVAIFAEAGVRLWVTLGFMPPTRPGDLDTVDARQQAAAAAARRLAHHPCVRAVGECGLDFYWPCVGLVREGALTARADGEPPPPEEAWHLPAFQRFRAIQARAFRRWIDLAVEVDLPLVIHERLAHADAVEIVSGGALGPERIMFHCFGAGPAEARAAAARGSVVSLPASLVVRERYREVAAATPLASLLSETDSPYHSPMVGLWKRAREAAEAEVDIASLPKKRREGALNAARDAHLRALLEAVWPGLAFPTPALEHLRESGARYRGEPTWVRVVAHEVATLQDRPVDVVQAALTARAERFFMR
jgi:Tat protein secretion system quality control protein TatD with DNase activity